MSMPLNADIDYLRLYSPGHYGPGGEFEAEEVGQPELRLWSDSTGLALLTEDGSEAEEAETPTIFKFHQPMFGERPRTQTQLLARMKMVHRNRRCRHCDSPIVVPIQRNNAELNRNGMPIPGTATLIGFRCRQCSAEWRV